MHFKQGAGRGPICRWQLPTDDVQIVDGVQLAVLGKRHQIRPVQTGGDAVWWLSHWGQRHADRFGMGGVDLHASKAAG